MPQRIGNAWRKHLNRLEVDFEEEAKHPNLFQDTFRCRPSVFKGLMERLELPEKMLCEQPHAAFSGETALLVLLARLGTSGAGHIIGSCV
eukprot:jgi/Tetstr1/438539/TSEL_027091.t1